MMPSRDEGTGASIEPRNDHDQVSGLAVSITRRLQSVAQWWVRLNYASHTEIRILPPSAILAPSSLRLIQPQYYPTTALSPTAQPRSTACLATRHPSAPIPA